MTTDESARLLFYAIIGLAAASWLFYSSRNRLGEVARNAMVWALILCGLMIVYGFKDTLFAQLNPTAVRISEANAIEIQRSRDGHFYADLEVNGRTVEFIIDTGASDVVLTREDAERAGIDVDSLNFRGRAQTANGEVSTASLRLNEIRLGNFSESNFRASVNGGELFASLLGMSFLDRFRKIEIQGNLLTLWP